jgi:hypothetical protein
MIGQLQTGSISQITFITLFSRECQSLLCLLSPLAERAHVLGQNHFHPILICRVTY